jgi:hypothetical protein
MQQANDPPQHASAAKTTPVEATSATTARMNFFSTLISLFLAKHDTYRKPYRERLITKLALYVLIFPTFKEKYSFRDSAFYCHLPISTTPQQLALLALNSLATA